MNYGFDVRMDTPQYVDVMRNAEERAYRESQDRKKAFQNMMQMLSRGAAAYKLKRDYDNYLDDWDGQEDELNMISRGYYDPEDLDVDKILAGEKYNTDDWRAKYGNSHRYGVDLAKLGLIV